jgi:hypothetical protein
VFDIKRDASLARAKRIAQSIRAHDDRIIEAMDALTKESGQIVNPRASR